MQRQVQQVEELTGVADGDRAGPGGALAGGVGEVGASEFGPAGLALHAEPDPAEVGGLDQGGADAAHRVQHQLAGLAVALDGGAGDGGQHLGGVGGGRLEVAAGALAGGGLLGGRPDRHGDQSEMDGRVWFYRLSDLQSGVTDPVGSFLIPRDQADEYCSAHMFNVVPVKDRYLLVSSWYGGGTDVIDFTDPANAREIAYYDVESPN